MVVLTVVVTAYIVADHWPEEYDGIVSGCMGMDLTGQTVGWLNLGSRIGTHAMPSFDQWTAVTTAAVKECDALDNVTDGMIANQSACNFDVTALQCGQPAADPNPAICLTSAQVQTVKDVNFRCKTRRWHNCLFRLHLGRLGLLIFPVGVFLGGGNAILATGDSTWFTQAKQQSFKLDRDYRYSSMVSV